MNIGRVAKLAGVNVETIRYYQRRGLIAEPAKPLGAYRRYPPEIVGQIRFIKRAQALGFTLDEIALLLRPPTAEGCAQVHELVLGKIRALRIQIDSLTRCMRTLEQLIDQCRGMPACATCPLRGHLSCVGELWEDKSVRPGSFVKVAATTGHE